jgi:hypothetical protein
MMIRLSEAEFMDMLYKTPVGEFIEMSQDEHLNLIRKTERILCGLRNLYTSRPVLVSCKTPQSRQADQQEIA